MHLFSVLMFVDHSIFVSIEVEIKADCIENAIKIAKETFVDFKPSDFRVEDLGEMENDDGSMG